MKLSRSRYLRRLRRKLVKSVKSKKVFFSVHAKFFRRSGYIMFSLLCGFFLSKTQIVITYPSNTTQNPVIVSAYKEDAPSEPNNVVHPIQTNPLFVSKPSWAQDFSNYGVNNINPQYWSAVVGPAQNSNNEQQYYTAHDSNIRIENGTLRLVATREPQAGGYQYSSSRIETQNKQTFLFGRFDIIAKLPKGTGTWPAVWMLPANKVYADLSPQNSIYHYKNGGEIDIIESVGFHPDVVYAVTHVASDVVNRPDGTGTNGFVIVPNSSTEFNKYTLLWTPNSLEFLVNDQSFYTYTRSENADYTTWPYDQPFYLIMNLALGGSWGGMDQANFPGNGIDDSSLPASLDVKSIHYYSYVGQKSNAQ